MRTVTYTVYQRLQKSRGVVWVACGTFEERDDASCRKDGLRKFLRQNGIDYDASSRCRWLYKATAN